MKQKRLLFVILTCMVAVVCLIHMNRSYDPLSRYPYELSESQHSAVLNALSSDFPSAFANLCLRMCFPSQWLLLECGLRRGSGRGASFRLPFLAEGLP